MTARFARYRTNRQGEVESAALYRAMAEAQISFIRVLVNTRIAAPKSASRYGGGHWRRHPPMTQNHPTRRFTPAALNAAFRVDSGRSWCRYRTAEADLTWPFADTVLRGILGWR